MNLCVYTSVMVEENWLLCKIHNILMAAVTSETVSLHGQ